MQKITKEFSFQMPLTRASYGQKKTHKMGNLEVTYKGHEYPRMEPEERYDIDILSIRFKGMELYPLFMADQFDEVMGEIADAAYNDVEFQFTEYHAGRAHDEAEMQMELRRIS